MQDDIDKIEYNSDIIYNKKFKILKEYYAKSEKWDSEFINNNPVSIKKSLEMYERINSLNPSLVIDAGCGDNLHKHKIKNLIGFDPFLEPEHRFPNTPGPDFKSSILDANFELESADAVLALGSINFISYEYIQQNFEKIYSWVKPNGLIEFKTHDGFSSLITRTDKNFHKKWGIWSREMIDYFTKTYNLDYVVEPEVFLFESENDQDAQNRWGKDSNYKKFWTWIKL